MDETNETVTEGSSFEERCFEAQQAYNAGEFEKSVRLIDDLTKQNTSTTSNKDDVIEVSVTSSSSSLSSSAETTEITGDNVVESPSESPTLNLTNSTTSSSSTSSTPPTINNLNYISLKTNRALAQFKLDSNVENLLNELSLPSVVSSAKQSSSNYQIVAFLIYNRSIALSVYCFRYQEATELLEQFVTDQTVWSYVDHKLLMKMFMTLIVILVEKVKRPSTAMNIIDLLCKFCKSTNRSALVPDYYYQLQMRCQLMLNKTKTIPMNKPIPELISLEPHVRSELEFRQGKFSELCNYYRFYKDGVVEKHRTQSLNSKLKGKTENSNSEDLNEDLDESADRTAVISARLSLDSVGFSQLESELAAIYNNSGVSAFYNRKLLQSAAASISKSIKINPTFKLLSKSSLSVANFPFEQFYNLALVWLHSGNYDGSINIFYHFTTRYQENPLIWLRLGESFLLRHYQLGQNKDHQKVQLLKNGHFTEMKGNEHFRCRMMMRKTQHQKPPQKSPQPELNIDNLLLEEDSSDDLHKALFCFQNVLKIVPSDFVTTRKRYKFEPHFFFEDFHEDNQELTTSRLRKLFLIRSRTLLHQSYINLQLGNYRTAYSVANQLLLLTPEASSISEDNFICRKLLPISDLALAHLYAGEAALKLGQIRSGRKLLNFNHFWQKAIQHEEQSPHSLVDSYQRDLRILQSIFVYNTLAAGAQHGLVKDLSKRLQQFVRPNSCWLWPGQLYQLSTFEHYWNNHADRARLVANNRTLVINSSLSGSSGGDGGGGAKSKLSQLSKPSTLSFQQQQQVNQQLNAAVAQLIASSPAYYQNLMSIPSSVIDFTSHLHPTPNPNSHAVLSLQQQQLLLQKQKALMQQANQQFQQQQQTITATTDDQTANELRQRQLREHLANQLQYQQQQQQVAAYAEQIRILQQQQQQQQQQQSGRVFLDETTYQQPGFRTATSIEPSAEYTALLRHQQQQSFSSSAVDQLQSSGTEFQSSQRSSRSDPKVLDHQSQTNSERKIFQTMFHPHHHSNEKQSSKVQQQQQQQQQRSFTKKTSQQQQQQVQSLTSLVRPVATEFGPIIPIRGRTPFGMERTRPNSLSSTGSSSAGSSSTSGSFANSHQHSSGKFSRFRAE